ncbi:MAG: DUF2780 domain-containing protein [Gammaproteobacteria bacterium]
MTKLNRMRVAPLLISMISAGCAGTGGSGESVIGKVDTGLANVAQTAQTGRQVIQAGTAAASTGTSVSQTGLTNILVNQLGVTQQQALGGAGAIFQAAKANMAAPAFSNLSQSIPGMSDMLAAAPRVSQPLSGVSSVLGGASGTVNTVTTLASQFQQLQLSPNMVNRFIPVVVDYVKNTSGHVTANLLQSALPTP